MGIKAWMAAAAAAAAMGAAGAASAGTTVYGTVDTSTFTYTYSPKGVLTSISGTFDWPTPATLNPDDNITFDGTLSSPIDLSAFKGTGWAIKTWAQVGYIESESDLTPTPHSLVRKIADFLPRGSAVLTDFMYFVQYRGPDEAPGYTSDNYPHENPPPLSLQGPVSFTITTVPEPSTWALAILGLGLIGAAARRRRVSAPACA